MNSYCLSCAVLASMLSCNYKFNGINTINNTGIRESDNRILYSGYLSITKSPVKRHCSYCFSILSIGCICKMNSKRPTAIYGTFCKCCYWFWINYNLMRCTVLAIVYRRSHKFYSVGNSIRPTV